METNIILCSDGTGNTTVKNRGTNVFKLFEAIDTHHTSPPQLSVYDDGVGSGTSKISQALGGGVGYGLSRNVKQLYTALVRNYNPGDSIYMFGFSRGAFTVRSLAGMISYMGIIDREHCKTDAELIDYVEHAYREYRHSQRAWLETILSFLFIKPVHTYQRIVKKKVHMVSHTLFKEQFSIQPSSEDKKLIRFIGVWDTVNAVGFPVPWVRKLFNKLMYRFSFTDNYLNKDVEQACQALSIDDQRKTFTPEIWDESKAEDKKRITQVWFSGVHSNVGGGYVKQGMSLVPLNWMMRQAHDAGLHFIKHDMDLYDAKQNVYDKLYDSRHGLSVYYRFKPRNIYKLCKLRGVDVSIHSSAIDRIYQGTQGYAPGNIPNGFEIVDADKTPCHWPAANKEISEALGKDTSLLRRVPYLYAIRKFAHGVFFAATAYVIVDYILKNGYDGVMGTAIAFFKYLLLQDESSTRILCGLIAITLFYIIMMLTKEKMHSKYSAFWYSLISKHSKTLSQ